MIEQLNAALPSIISGIILLAVGGAVGALGKTLLKLFSFSDEHRMLLGMRKQFKVLIGEHRKLMECNRNQNKAMIVSLFEDARARGGIVTPMELDTANRLADSYFALGGNHYIHTVVKQLNGMEIVGEPIEPESIRRGETAGVRKDGYGPGLRPWASSQTNMKGIDCNGWKQTD